MLDHIGRPDIGVYAGAATPYLPRPVPPDGRWLPPHLPIPASRSRARGQPAAAWLVETLRSAVDPVTVVATGPLTNLAQALDLDPGLEVQVVFLGGTDQVPSVTPMAERNVWNDPAAVVRVLAAGLDLTMVTLDATKRAPLDRGDVAGLRALGTPAATAAADFVAERIDQYAGFAAEGEAPVHDPLAVACVLDPAVVTLQLRAVAVDLTAGPSYARTEFRTDRPPNARVAFHAHRSRFVDLLRETLSRQG